MTPADIELCIRYLEAGRTENILRAGHVRGQANKLRHDGQEEQADGLDELACDYTQEADRIVATVRRLRTELEGEGP